MPYVSCHITVWGAHFTLGLSLICSNITLLFYFRILPYYCHYSQKVLLLCSNCAYFIIEKTPRTWRGTNILPLASVSPRSSSSLLLLMVRMLLFSCWSLLTCFSKFSQLNPPNLFPAIWWFAHAPCYYSGTMFKCFWFAIIPGNEAKSYFLWRPNTITLMHIPTHPTQGWRCRASPRSTGPWCLLHGSTRL